MNILLCIILFAPLLGFLVSFVGDCFRSGLKTWVRFPCLMMCVSCAAYVVSWMFYESGDVWISPQLNWIDFNDIQLSWGLYYDTLAAVMVGVVVLISLCVHGYAIGYMEHDAHRARFMALLSFFTFAMLLLLMSSNLVQMFMGWETVGLASYLLIGFWHHRPQAIQAAQKAFVVNRVADVGLLIGILSTWQVCGGLDWTSVFSALEKVVEEPSTGFVVMAIAFTIAAMGKSAQFGLHVWLPDAMEGPTPVSALIHAATMVTAGIFLIVRLSPLYEIIPYMRDALVWIGLLTTFFAGTVALVQRDIKRIIAYSTCSQLGMMMMACGCGAYSVAIFHLVTHAFFKALLFLGAGSVIHALSDEQDVFQMGGVWRHIPFTYVCMWIGSLALIGAPFFAGYYSKEAIMSSIYDLSWPCVFEITLACVLLTALYSGRLLFLVFHGACRAHEQVMAHIHEVKGLMRITLASLSVGAIVVGWVGHHLFLGQDFGFGWGESLVYQPVASTPLWVHYSPTLIAVVGVFGSFFVYGGRSMNQTMIVEPHILKDKIYHFLSENWWIDKIYYVLWEVSYRWLSHFLAYIDMFFDAKVPDSLANIAQWGGERLRLVHTRWLYNSVMWIMIAFMMLLVCVCRP